MDASELRRFVQGEPLLDMPSTIDGLSRLEESIGEASIFFGIGLSTPQGMSCGLPFDYLSMLLVGEKLRQAFRLRNVYQYIADTHAIVNSPSKAEVRLLAGETAATMETIALNLGLRDVRVDLASDVDKDPLYPEILNSLSAAVGNEYVLRELAAIHWYRLSRGLQIKLGWVLSGADAKIRMDERYYDRKYADVYPGHSVGFAYVKSGRTFSALQPRAVPYIALQTDDRLMLRPDEPIEQKLGVAKRRRSKQAVAHLQAIIRLFEETIAPLGDITWEAKIQRIYSAAFKTTSKALRPSVATATPSQIVQPSPHQG